MSIRKFEILNFKQVQEILGVSRSYLYKATSQGKIPCYRPTKGKLFFKSEEVLAWLTQQGGNQINPSNITNFKNDFEDGK